jgi:tRNA pseudouridine38-40 synthase
MPRFVLEISYDGSGFSGWQTQPHKNSVQDAVESALASVGETGRVAGAGRTDGGVHARAQVAHFDAIREWEPRRLVLALNAYLPPSVSVMRAAAARSDFHARRDAVSREYRYFIWNSPACYPHIKPYVFWLPGSHYVWERAARAARALAGEHDFAAFCRAADRPEGTRRTVISARLHSRGRMKIFRIVANAYLTNMVRIIVGNMSGIAAGRRDENWLAEMLESGASVVNDKTAPASGLFLWKVNYVTDIWRE